jgi:molybdopterin molybdotransferase
MITVNEARLRITNNLDTMPSEQVNLNNALGRVLGEDLSARRTQPPLSVSAMDGYAVNSSDITKAPINLKVIGSVPAGTRFSGAVTKGTTVRIFTGAPVPEGADAIVIQENTERLDDSVIVKEIVKSGRYIRKAGLDFKSGDVLLKKGSILNARHIGLAAAMNISWLKVRVQPRIAILATGNEIALPGDILEKTTIVSSNNYALEGLVKAYGGSPLTLGIAEDNIDSISMMVDSAIRAGSDIIVTTGGASVGDHDLVQKALGQVGLKVDFWQIAMRPGKPLIFGHINSVPMLGFPGNPVSSMVCGELFLKSAIFKLLGIPNIEPVIETAILGRDLNKNDNREDYLRATLEINNDGMLVATPFLIQDSSMFSRLAQADCLIVRAPGAHQAYSGEKVNYISLGGGLIST